LYPTADVEERKALQVSIDNNTTMYYTSFDSENDEEESIYDLATFIRGLQADNYNVIVASTNNEYISELQTVIEDNM
jgi:hypothetical protein